MLWYATRLTGLWSVISGMLVTTSGKSHKWSLPLSGYVPDGFWIVCCGRPVRRYRQPCLASHSLALAHVTKIRLSASCLGWSIIAVISMDSAPISLLFDTLSMLEPFDTLCMPRPFDTLSMPEQLA